MILSNGEIELHHFTHISYDAAARNQVAPLSMQVDEAEIHQPVHDEQPHHREMPVPRTGEPAAKRETRRNRFTGERIAAERLAAPRERWIRIEDAQPARHHDRQRDHVHPMGDPYYGVMSFHAL